MEIYKKISKGVLVVLFVMGCSHKTEKEVQRKVAEESHVSSIEQFNDESDKAIDAAEGISDAQKAKLIVLRRGS